MNATTIKIIGMIAMTIDHIGYFLFPSNVGLRIIGRIAYPIFAYMIAEGCRYTKNKTKYFLSVLSVGCICSFVSYIAERSLYQSILITFSCSIILIFTLEEIVTNRNSLLKRCIFALLSILLIAIYACLFGKNVILGLEIDYGFYGIVTPVLVYFVKNKLEKLLALAIGLFLIAIDSLSYQMFSFVAIGILAFYDGKRGNYDLKYLFYIYYPIHIALLYVISEFMN